MILAHTRPAARVELRQPIRVGVVTCLETNGSSPLLLSVFRLWATLFTLVVQGAKAVVTMVVQPHLTLTLEALGSGGVVLPLEQKVFPWSALLFEPLCPAAGAVCLNIARYCRLC